MSTGGLKGIRAAWRVVDDTLRSISEALQRFVRTLRGLRALLLFGLLVIIASAVVGIVWPQWFPYAYAAAVVFLILPLAVLLALVWLPLRAKSVVRLIDMGYPQNAKELVIRGVARKMNEESIESEELLFETVWNESRKTLRRYRQRMREAKAEADLRDDDPLERP